MLLKIKLHRLQKYWILCFFRLELEQFSGQRLGKPSSRWKLPQRSLSCFKALQKQEQLAASHRIDSIWKEVQKQKELEQTLQRRYEIL